MCYKCDFYGHISKYCQQAQRCLQCAESDHKSTKEQLCQKAEKKYINCNGFHSTVDRQCPLYIRNAEIAKIMAHDNLPFFEAKSLIMRQEKKAIPAPPFVKSIKNFLLLL